MYPQTEREFDRVLKKAMPYLIFSPNSIRDTVADYIKSIWLAMRNGNQVDFDLHCKNVNEIIANSDRCTDSFVQCNISDFDARWSGLDESISKLRRELVELRIEIGKIKEGSEPIIEGMEKRGQTKKFPEFVPSEISPDLDLAVIDAYEIAINENVKSNVETSIEGMIKRKRGRPRKDAISEPEIAPMEIIKSPKPATSLPATCPSCGKILKHESIKSGEIYYCFKSREGCGKRYVVGSDGELIDKTTIIKPYILCKCGKKLHGHGKQDIDGELYQLYVCNSSAKGGCGTYYIMDKDGDLHVGRSKIALERPKIFQKQNMS